MKTAHRLTGAERDRAIVRLRELTIGAAVASVVATAGLASVAAAIRIEDGTLTEVRLALGGVGTTPWRARRAEAALLGRPPTTTSFAAAAREVLAQATPRPMNAFKVELAQRAIVRALNTLTDGDR